MIKLLILLLLLLSCGCATRTRIEYYETGEIKAQEVEEYFTLGTKGAGTYGLIVLYVEANNDGK